VIVHRLDGPPGPDLALALAAFETAFTYPLGVYHTFRISHGDDYHRFFRAIGRAACFVAEERGAVRGTLAVVIRRLGLPDGREQQVTYVADLKVADQPGRGRTLLQLARAAESWAHKAADTAFAVVMDGTRATPTAYTGRLGIPEFGELAHIVVFRFSATGEPSLSADDVLDDASRGEAIYGELSRGRFSSLGGEPRVRSLTHPMWLVRSDGAACGRLEDTRAAKRLWRDDGAELVSAHLSAFAFRTPAAGASVVAAALRQCAHLGYPALFVAVAAEDAEDLRRALPAVEALAAPATVYGTGVGDGFPWNINSAEI
jgi:hypothetical protein